MARKGIVPGPRHASKPEDGTARAEKPRAGPGGSGDAQAEIVRFAVTAVVRLLRDAAIAQRGHDPSAQVSGVNRALDRGLDEARQALADLGAGAPSSLSALRRVLEDDLRLRQAVAARRQAPIGQRPAGG